MRMKMVATAAIAVAISSMVGFIQTTPANAANTNKVTICHRTNSVTNPYTSPTVSFDAATGALKDNGQGDHTNHAGPVWDANTTYPAPHNGDQWGDIIPPYTWPGDKNHPGGSYPGLNWTAEGMAIYNNDCKPVQTVDYCDPTQRPRGMSIANWVPVNVHCVEPSVAHVCGELTGTITNLTPYNYDISWSEGAPDYNFNTSLTTSPVTFPEDYNGGSVEVFYWVVGAEADYVTGRNIPNYWEQSAASVTVDTDCKGEPGRGGGTPTEPTKPNTPAEETVTSLPTTSGSGETAALISLSTLSVVTIAGALIRRHFNALSL